MALAGPALVKTAVGEDIDIEKLGGSAVHTSISGVGHLECEDDRDCIETIKHYLGYFPSHFRDKTPIIESSEPRLLSNEVFDLVPENTRRAFDIRKIIKLIADKSIFFEVQPNWAKNMVVGLIRVGGFPIGVVANQPEVLGGALDLDAADKATRFINVADAFGIALLFLHDCPGFMVGSKMEHAGIIRHGAKMLYAVSRITSPKISVIIRKSYGAGYYVMCGKGYEPDLIVAWPGSEISLMSPEGAVNIISNEPDKNQLVTRYRSMIGAEKSAQAALIDDVIDPRETARVLYRHLRVLVPKHDRDRSMLGSKKHGISPV